MSAVTPTSLARRCETVFARRACERSSRVAALPAPGRGHLRSAWQPRRVLPACLGLCRRDVASHTARCTRRGAGARCAQRVHARRRPHTAAATPARRWAEPGVGGVHGKRAARAGEGILWGAVRSGCSGVGAAPGAPASRATRTNTSRSHRLSRPEIVRRCASRSPRPCPPPAQQPQQPPPPPPWRQQCTAACLGARRSGPWRRAPPARPELTPWCATA